MRTAGWICAILVALTGCASRTDDDAPLAGIGIALTNAGFEAAPGADGAIEGWSLSQHAGPVSYKTGIDRRVHAKGAASFRIERIREQVYGAIEQTVPIAAQAGHTIELSAKMKTEHVGPAGWQLTLTFTGGVPNPVHEATPLSGTQDFRTVTIRTRVPPGAQQAQFGAALLDSGTAWLDDVNLRVVD
ncbi:MAG: hypothetical protein JSS42_14250 [Proteobacteria bacterium]|uniref:hypothetical protein n=1 Tax=Rudaea sp. TaxID=2136325 RepID=UPI00321FEAB5|nr:hypothetical protein [Pseudomonadota bacterium]